VHPYTLGAGATAPPQPVTGIVGAVLAWLMLRSEKNCKSGLNFFKNLSIGR
jgi:hypothetical protein